MSANTLGLAYAADIGAVSQYTGMPFTSFLRVGGKLYGTTPDGLYLIGGDTDAGADIPWQASGPMTDAGAVEYKRVRRAIVSGPDTENVTLGLVFDNGDAPTVSERKPGGLFSVGRNGSGRAMQFQLSGIGPVNMTGITLEALILGQKARG